MKEIKSNYRFTLFLQIIQLLMLPAIYIISFVIYIPDDVLNIGSLTLAYYYGYLIFYKQYNVKIKEKLKIKNKNILTFIYDIISGIFIIMVYSNILRIIYQLLGYSGDGEVNLVLTPLYVVEICIIAPIIEEIIFRGFAYNTLKSKGKVFAIIMSSFLFALFHYNYVQFASTLCLGLVLCSLDEKYDSILPGIVLHIINNMIATGIFGYLNDDTTRIVLYIIIFILVIIYFINSFKGKKLEIIENIKEIFRLSSKSLSFYLVVLINIILFVLQYLGIIEGLY